MVKVYSPLTWGMFDEPPPDIPECGFLDELCPPSVKGKPSLSDEKHVCLRNRRWGGMRICFTDVFFVFVFAFFPSATTMRQPFSGTPERIFMKILSNDSEENGVFNVVPKWRLGPQIIFWGSKLTSHVLVSPLGESLRISLKRGYLYGGCVKKAWTSECI